MKQLILCLLLLSCSILHAQKPSQLLEIGPPEDTSIVEVTNTNNGTFKSTIANLRISMLKQLAPLVDSILLEMVSQGQIQDFESQLALVSKWIYKDTSDYVSNRDTISADSLKVHAEQIYGGVFSPLNDGRWSVTESQWASGTIQTWGIGGLTAASGHTVVANTMDATNTLTLSRRVTSVSAATAASPAGWRHPRGLLLRGNGSLPGGGWVAIDWGWSQLTSDALLFAGLKNLGTAFGDVTAPGAQTNIVGVGRDATDGTLQIITNDGSGAATKMNTGITASTTTFYRLLMKLEPNGNIKLWMYDLSPSGATFSTTLTANLPDNTSLLTWYVHASNNATAASVAVDLGRVYVKTF